MMCVKVDELEERRTNLKLKKNALGEPCVILMEWVLELVSQGYDCRENPSLGLLLFDILRG